MTSQTQTELNDTGVQHLPSPRLITTVMSMVMVKPMSPTLYDEQTFGTGGSANYQVWKYSIVQLLDLKSI